MMDNNQGLNLFQLALLLTHAQIGVGVVTYVHAVHMDARSDSWLSVLLAGFFIQILILIYGIIIKRFPDLTLFEVMEIVFGKAIGKMFTIIYVCYLFLIGAAILSQYALILKTWMMPLTPKWVLILFISVVGIYAAKEKMHIIIRFLIPASFVIFIFIGFVIYAFKDANYTYLLPVGKVGFSPIFKGAVTTSYAYQGLSYILIYAPFIKSTNKQIVKTTTLINVFITLFYLFIVLATQLFFSSPELDLVTEPIFYLVKSFSFSIIERPDLLFTSMWIVLVATSVIILLKTSSIGLHALFSSDKRTLFVIITAIVINLIAILIYGEYKNSFFTQIMNKLIIFFAIVLPLIILLFSFLLNRKGEQNR